eukprot:scaffold145234_cov428-Phaeocystis_antarctica.AAC.1
MSAPRRRRDREEVGGVGRDVRATQHELAPELRRVGSALGLSVHLSQSRGCEGRGGTWSESTTLTYWRARPCPGMWRSRPLTQRPNEDLRARGCRSRCSS